MPETGTGNFRWSCQQVSLCVWIGKNYGVHLESASWLHILNESYAILPLTFFLFITMPLSRNFHSFFWVYLCIFCIQWQGNKYKKKSGSLIKPRNSNTLVWWLQNGIGVAIYFLWNESWEEMPKLMIRENLTGSALLLLCCLDSKRSCVMVSRKIEVGVERTEVIKAMVGFSQQQVK